MSIHLGLYHITKTFPGVVANKNVNLEIQKGEIHALLGENGAGKTTLMNCIYGLYQPDAGEIVYEGKRVCINNVKDSISLGINMVHQHFMLVDSFTVLDNIIMGMPPDKPPFVNRKKAAKQLDELSRQYGLEIDLHREVWQLPVGMQQRVEIIKALYRKAKLLILDEPTAVLTPEEVRDFFAVLRNLKAAGYSIIIITHKFDEVLEISDRVTVMRSGEVVDTIKTSEVDKPSLARMMIGRELHPETKHKQQEQKTKVLEVQNVSCVDERGVQALDKLNFDVYAGEIVSVAGVSGNGQTELAKVLSGMMKASSGQAVYKGANILHKTPAQLYEMGLAHVPEDRHSTGLILDMNVTENLIMGLFRKGPFSKKGIVNHKAIAQYSQKMIQKFDIKAPSINTLVRLLSGGNQQKLILGREMYKQPDLMIVVQPTRGLDVGATEFVQDEIRKERERGAAIIYISTELDEIMAMSDRVIVMFEGRQYGPFDVGEVDCESLGLMMAGAYPTQEKEA